MRLGEKRVGVLRVDTHHEAALTAGGERHVAADEEGETSEHLLLRDVGIAVDQFTDAVGESSSYATQAVIAYRQLRQHYFHRGSPCVVALALREQR
jgi:hypothetical protein